MTYIGLFGALGLGNIMSSTFKQVLRQVNPVSCNWTLRCGAQEPSVDPCSKDYVVSALGSPYFSETRGSLSRVQGLGFRV